MGCSKAAGALPTAASTLHGCVSKPAASTNENTNDNGALSADDNQMLKNPSWQTVEYAYRRSFSLGRHTHQVARCRRRI
jgi:hypothetical protein